MKKTKLIAGLPIFLPEDLPIHVNCRCVAVPVAPAIQLPSEDVLAQAERVVAEYEAAQKHNAITPIA